MNSRKSIFLFTLLFITFAVFPQGNVKSPLGLSFNYIGNSKCNDSNDCYISQGLDSCSTIFGELRLTNKSNDAISIWIMSYSWTDLICLSSKDMKLQVKICNANRPTKISLFSGQSIMFNAIIEVPTKDLIEAYLKTLDGKDQNSFQIGFILIKGNEYKISEEISWNKVLEFNKKNESIIWTSPIELYQKNYRWRISTEESVTTVNE